MIHELLLVLSGFKSSIVALESTLITDDSSLLHPSEQTLLARTAQFGDLHRVIIDAVQRFEYETNTSGSQGSQSGPANHGSSHHPVRTTEKLTPPKSYILIRAAIVSVIETHLLHALSKELENMETAILRKDSKYVGGDNTVAVAQIVGINITKWHRVLKYAKYILEMLDIIPLVSNEKSNDTRSSKRHTTTTTDPLFNELELTSPLYSISSDAKNSTFKLKKNVFTLFSNLIGYPEVDSLRQHCLTAVHRSWLQLVSSWLLYGHVSVASSAFENNFDEAEQHKLVEELLVNKDKPQTSTANYLDGDTTNNDDNVMNGDISQSLFLPPGVTPEMGYLIYTTGNVVRLFVGFSSHGANGTSASLGVDSANLFQNIHSASQPSQVYHTFSRPSTSSSAISGISIQTSSLSYIPTYAVVNKYVARISSLSLPISPFSLFDIVTELRSSVLKEIGTTEFSKPRVWAYFYTLRRIVLGGDVEFNTLFTEQLLQTREEAEKRAGVKPVSRIFSGASSHGNLSFYENLYDSEEDDEMGSNSAQSTRPRSGLLGVPKVTSDSILKRLAPETLRRALMSVAESMNESDEFEYKNLILHSHRSHSRFQTMKNGQHSVTKHIQTKKMYLDAIEFLDLAVVEQEDAPLVSKRRRTSQRAQLSNIGQRSGTDIFKTTFLDIPTQLNFQLNWFQATLTKLPELDCAKYSILFSFLMSLFMAHQLLTDQWKASTFKRGPSFRGSSQHKLAIRNGEYDLKEPFEDLLHAIQHTRVFLTEVWDYFQVTVIEQSFSKLLNKCFPPESKEHVRASTRTRDHPRDDYTNSAFMHGDTVIDADIDHDMYSVNNDKTNQLLVEPDTIAQLHQDFISDVYDTIFLDSDALSEAFLNLVLSIKSTCSWLSRNSSQVMSYTVGSIEAQEAAILEMRKYEKVLYQCLESIVNEVEIIQQSDDEAATKYPLHLLLLRIEFVRERTGKYAEDNYEDTEMDLHV